MTTYRSPSQALAAVADPWASPAPVVGLSRPAAPRNHPIDPECHCDTCWKYTSGVTYE